MRIRTAVTGAVALGVLATTTVLSGALVGGTTAGATSAATQALPTRPDKPLVVGHRGTAGYRPEHTLASYQLAINLGADYVEPDLVSTKDHVLVARHENYISETTDVATHPEFADRETTKVVDGVSLTGWFTEDFTLAELKTLRAKERIPTVRPDNAIYDGRYQVPTFQEVLELVKRESARTGRTIGIIPETKHPTYFDGLGLSLEEPTVALLHAYGYDDETDAAAIQSFEVGNLKELNTTTNVRLVQLFGGSGQPYDFTAAGVKITYDDMGTRNGIRQIRTYADVLGPNKDRIIAVTPAGTLGTPTSFVRDAHQFRLGVVPYTFRNENRFLPPALRIGTDPNAYGNAFAEYAAFYKAGVDGLFSDNADTALAARDE